jgi:IS5 family transposase
MLDNNAGFYQDAGRTRQNEMTPKPTTPQAVQTQFLMSRLSEMLDSRDPLCRLSKVMDWSRFEKEFGPLYSDEGRPGLPIWRMAGLLMLRQLCNLSDECVVEQHRQNPYHQYFCGEEQSGWSGPCAAGELAYFRKRIGEKGTELILAESIRLHGEKARESEVVMDTTAHEKAITYPTDTKMHAKIIGKTVRLAKKTKVKLRQSHTRTVPKLPRAQRGWRHPKGHKGAKKAAKKLKTIAGRLVRELERKLPAGHARGDQLELYKRVFAQKKTDKHKLYSLHEPHVYCMARGKARKPYEFGTKASIVRGKNNNVILGAKSFEENICDGHTPEAALEQVERVAHYRPEVGNHGPRLPGKRAMRRNATGHARQTQGGRHRT